jgi:NurA-like 5'-3' nuclease
MAWKTIRIKEGVYNQISEYCKMNNMTISDFCSDQLENAILSEKYGDTPFGTMVKTPRVVETDVKTVTPDNAQKENISTTFVETEKPNIVEVDLTKKVEEVPTQRKRRL